MYPTHGDGGDGTDTFVRCPVSWRLRRTTRWRGFVGPLQGVKIVELAGIGPGPFAGMLLSDMGADIVRIDRANQVNPGLFERPNLEPLFRGRRSIGVDLKNPDGVEAVLRLVEQADALI